MMILMLLTTTTTTTMSTETDIKLRAFSCSSPRHLRDYQITHNYSCGPTTTPLTSEPRPYTIAQKKSYNKASGFKCSKRVSRFTFICTSNAVAAHQRLAAVPVIEVPEEVSWEECNKLVTTQEYEGPDGVRHATPLGKTTVIQLHEAGREEITGQTIVCVGEQVKIGDRIINGVAILEQVKIQTMTMRFKVDVATATIQSWEEHKTLPCDGLYLHCVTSEGTYLWQHDKSTPFERVRTISAQLLVEEGQEVIISQESKIRLVLGEAERHDGREYRSTKYPAIFVLEGEAPYLDALSSDHLKLTSWIACRDDFLAYSMEKKMMEAYQAMSGATCKRQADLLRSQMATAFTSDTGSHHLHLGPNLFGAIIGETLYTYACDPVLVTPREEERCTKELAVNFEGHRYYLEPSTRILKRYGNPIPCSQVMPPKYKTEDGRWIATTPLLMMTEAPRRVLEVTDNFTLTHEDMSEGGLYTPQQLDDFTRQLQYPLNRALVANSIYQEACASNPHEVCTAFTESLGSQVESSTNLLNLRGKVLRFLHDFGETAAIFIACYVIGTWLKVLADVLVACVTLRHVEGRRRWWQPITPLKWIISYDYGRVSQQARQQQQDGTAGAGLLQQQATPIPAPQDADAKLLDDLQLDEGFQT